jgi:hypothetical protein
VNEINEKISMGLSWIPQNSNSKTKELPFPNPKTPKNLRHLKISKRF